MIVFSEVVQNVIYSEELEYINFDVLLRITQSNEPRETDDDKLRIIQ